MLNFIIFFVFALAWLIHGFTGFGAAIIFTALLPFFIDVKTVIVSGGVGNLVGTVVLSSKNFNKDYNFKVLIPIFGSSFVGIFLGVKCLVFIKTDPLKLILGIILVCIGGYDFFVHALKIKRIKFRANNYTAVTIGMCAGFITGLLGTGGPLFVIYLNQIINNKNEFKLLLSIIFFVQIVIRIIFYLLDPVLRYHFDLMFILVSLPAVFLGVIVGNHLTKRVNNEQFKMIVSLSIIFLGFYTILERFLN